MTYSWQKEVEAIRRQAEIFRLEAKNKRYEADKIAYVLEKDAERAETKAAFLERLCSRRGTEPCLNP